MTKVNRIIEVDLGDEIKDCIRKRIEKGGYKDGVPGSLIEKDLITRNVQVLSDQFQREISHLVEIESILVRKTDPENHYHLEKRKIQTTKSSV